MQMKWHYPLENISKFYLVVKDPNWVMMNLVLGLVIYYWRQCLQFCIPFSHPSEIENWFSPIQVIEEEHPQHVSTIIIIDDGFLFMVW